MKKKTLQLNKKLVLRKDDIAPLSPGQLPAIKGGVITNPCGPLSQYCNVSLALSCASQCPGCRSFVPTQCISHYPGC